jgi:hypothetical protein
VRADQYAAQFLGQGRCADREIGTYDLLQTDHHKKDGYFRGFP